MVVRAGPTVPWSSIVASVILLRVRFIESARCRRKTAGGHDVRLDVLSRRRS